MKNKKRKSKIIVISLGTNDIRYSSACTELSSSETESGVVTVEIPYHCDERGKPIKPVTGDGGVIGSVKAEHRPAQAQKSVTTIEEFGHSVSTEGAGQASGFRGRYARRSEPADPK